MSPRLHAIGSVGGAVLGGFVGAGLGAGLGTLAVPGVGTLSGGAGVALEGAAIGSMGGLVLANAAEATAEFAVDKMAGFKDWIKRLVVGGVVWLGGGVPERVKGSDNPPEAVQPARPPGSEEVRPDEDEKPE